MKLTLNITNITDFGMYHFVMKQQKSVTFSNALHVQNDAFFYNTSNSILKVFRSGQKSFKYLQKFYWMRSLRK